MKAKWYTVTHSGGSTEFVRASSAEQAKRIFETLTGLKAVKVK